MTVTLDLNNFVIDRDLLDENPRPAGYVLKNEGTLTITDSSWEKLGAITGGDISFNDSGKGGAGVGNYGTFIFSGGTITGNMAKTRGAGVWSGYDFTMTGGTIDSNIADDNGGGQ